MSDEEIMALVRKHADVMREDNENSGFTKAGILAFARSLVHSVEAVGTRSAAAGDASPCTRPPSGWLCSRPRNHTGPCAARPDRGITDSRCNYLGPTHGICNKCGRQHDGSFVAGRL